MSAIQSNPAGRPTSTSVPSEPSPGAEARPRIGPGQVALPDYFEGLDLKSKAGPSISELAKSLSTPKAKAVTVGATGRSITTPPPASREVPAIRSGLPTVRERINGLVAAPPHGPAANAAATTLRNLFARAHAGADRNEVVDAEAEATFMKRFNALSDDARTSLLAHAAALNGTPAARGDEVAQLKDLTTRAVDIYLRPNS
ncbi:MAG: hypothetical protein AAFU77_03555 [Myxococcota bacterium]